MMRVAIIDDAKEYTSLIGDAITVYAKKHNYNIEADTFTKPSNFLYEIKDGWYYDICFIDIEMPEMNGLMLAKKIREHLEGTYIVFVTSHFQYASEGYEFDASGYILKNEVRERIPEVLSRIIRKNSEDVQSGFYKLCTNTQRIKIDYRDIIQFYKDGKYTVIVTKHGEYRERRSLAEVAAKLPGERFIRPRQGVIVNMAFIEGVQGREISMLDGSNIEASRTTASMVREKISQYWEERL